MLVDIATYAVIAIFVLIAWQILKVIFYCIDIYHEKARATRSAEDSSANRERGRSSS